MNDSYISAKDLAQMLNLSRTSIYNLSIKGQIPRGQKIGGSRRWSLSEIQDWLKGNNYHAD